MCRPLALPRPDYSSPKRQTAGFLVIPGFAQPPDVAALLGRGHELLDGLDPGAVSVFSTRRQEAASPHKDNTYFFESAARVSFFFEEAAVRGEDGALTTAKQLAVNKIGHGARKKGLRWRIKVGAAGRRGDSRHTLHGAALRSPSHNPLSPPPLLGLHDADHVFRAFARSRRLAALYQDLGFHTPIPVQGMYICKQPSIGGEVVPHQDSTFLATDPPSVVGAWLALEDASVDNGCLWALPGSHTAPIARRFARTPGGGVGFDAPPADWDLSAGVPLPAAAGTLVLLHGSLVHWSAPNTSARSRHAFTVHVVEGQGAAWLDDNWLQRPSDMPFVPFDRVDGGEGVGEVPAAM